MKRAKKAVASLAIAAMALAMVPLNTLAEGEVSTRIAGYTAAQTAVQIAEQTGWTGTAILSSSTSYGMVDALTAGPLATFLKAPILLTEAGDKLNADTKAELVKLKVKTVYVTSGTGVISQPVLDQLRDMDITVVPLGGVDRFETSVNIANKMVTLGAKISKASVAYGWLNQDALSIASIASAQTEPTLLTEKDSIPASVEVFLAANTSVKTTNVIGGTGVISDSVKTQLPNATRYYGKTAYDTNLAVLKAFDSVLKYDRVFIANGETAIDALAGAPLAAKYNAGIVLTNGNANEGTAYVSSKLSVNSVVTALGGTAVVPDVVRTGIVYTAPPYNGGGGGGGYVPPSSTEIYSTAGTYGPASGKDTLQKNVQITASGVTLQNLTIDGDLEISESVGDNGNVYLNNVTVTGQTTVKGGGSSSIHINNSNLTGAFVVIKQGSKVRIVAKGSTSIPNVQLQSGVILKEEGLTGSSSGFGQVTVNTYTGAESIDLEGDFTDVSIEVPGVTISVPSGQIGNLTLGQGAVGSTVTSSGNIGQLNIQSRVQVSVQGGTVSSVTVGSNAANTTVNLAAGATITAVTLNAGTSVTGTGSIGTAVINASGTTIQQTPNSTTVGSGVTGGASVGGSTIPAGETVIVTPKVTSIISATTGTTLANISDNQIRIIASAANFKQPNIKVNQNSTMTLMVNRSGTEYNLGSWNLTNAASGNDIFSISNAPNMNILDILAALKATGVQSSAIFSAIDFHAILTASQSMDTTNKDKVYSSIANIFSQASSTSATNSFYQALNLPGVYAAVDSTRKTLISDIVTAAIPSGAGVTAGQLLGDTSSAAAIAKLTQDGNMAAFFSGINFQTLFDVLAASPNKEAIFTAINFTAMYNAIETLPDTNKLNVYFNAAIIYQAALTVDTGNAINYGALLQLVIVSPNTVTLSLTNTNGTKTTYSITQAL